MKQNYEKVLENYTAIYEKVLENYMAIHKCTREIAIEKTYYVLIDKDKQHGEE
jgi:hypothetical protein